MKKINITSIVLLVYLAVMSFMNWPGKKPNPNYGEYFLIIGISLLVVLLLRFVQLKQFKVRNKNKQEKI